MKEPNLGEVIVTVVLMESDPRDEEDWPITIIHRMDIEAPTPEMVEKFIDHISNFRYQTKGVANPYPIIHVSKLGSTD